MSLASLYTREIYDQRRYWAAWEPNVHLTLGQCGPIDGDGMFRAEGHLKDFGVAFDPDSDPAKSDTDYSSRSGLDITFQLKGGSQTIPNIPKGKAGIHIGFSSSEAVVLATKGAREIRIANQSQLRRDLLESADDEAGLPEGWFVITHLVTCDYASVVIAEGSGAKFEVSAEADFAAGVVDLANAELGLSVQTQSSIGYKLLANEGASPLFKGLRLKRTFWRNKPKLETLGPMTPNNDPKMAFEAVTPETVWDS